MSSAVRVRFAPSPTGYLHIGGARTALFNWLFAHHTGGTLVLRVEDTDEARNTAEAAQAIYGGLRWLGLDWDEGPQAGGNFGPYFQSERKEIYERHLAKLESDGHLFEDNGAIRFRSPREHVVVDDIVCGRIDFDLSNEETHPDMTIRRPDGSWIFHFVNVVDDIEMEISHVIRGEDHLSNTPKHIELYRALGAEPPRFAHIPLILNQDGSKMSKRDVGASLNTYIEEGFLPEAVRNYLCLLGWSPKDNREKIEIEEVVRLFELEKIHRKNASFDLAKCTWLNGEYARELPGDRFRALALIALAKAGLDTADFPRATWRPRSIPAKESSASSASCRLTAASISRTKSVTNRRAWRNISSRKTNRASKPCATLSLPWKTSTPPPIETVLKSTAASLGVKVGALVHPTRLAVTGSNAGPSLYHLLEILGRGKVLERMDAALKIIPA